MEAVAPRGALRAEPPGRLPDLRVGPYEFTTVTELLRGNHKDLLLFRPAFDIKGRDLLVQLVGTPRAVFVQVKGTAMRRGHDLVRFHVRRKAFVPAENFWFVLHFWDRHVAAFFSECWLVSSS